MEGIERWVDGWMKGTDRWVDKLRDEGNRWMDEGDIWMEGGRKETVLCQD